MTKDDIKDFIKFVVIALVIVGTIRLFIIEPYKVLGQSMVPTFTGIGNERVAIWKLGDYERGDIVVVKPEEQREKIIKRVIGLPGEKVQVRENKVFIEGKELSEPYLADGTLTESDMGDILVLGEHEYFVLGDNRPASHDSRRIGPVTDNEVIGRAVFQYSPRSAIKRLSRETVNTATLSE